MNPLCCIAPVSLERGDRGDPSPVGTLKAAKPQLGVESPSTNLSSKKLIQAPTIPSDSDAAARREAADEAAAAAGLAEGGDAKSGSGNGAVAGVLWKWVNYGKGWRSRWFVLQGGVLSYYKVHGPDRVSVGPAAFKAGVRVIGEESLRRVRKEQLWESGSFVGWGAVKQWKPFGEVHLKTEKVELETTVIDETKEREAHLGLMNGRFSVMSEGTATDSEADNESQGADAETDEDDGMQGNCKRRDGSQGGSEKMRMTVTSMWVDTGKQERKENGMEFQIYLVRAKTARESPKVKFWVTRVMALSVPETPVHSKVVYKCGRLSATGLGCVEQHRPKAKP
ncbi:oxysterol-binding protein [Musa troglodytarum]|uniref:Oxysterol-binding protein n=1 Tax=Musa troglodytarum TaxID=320322 RepID=A0A9E7KS26_9LILI|nr:oxysterol-binding protein [Musa troglodytarum]